MSGLERVTQEHPRFDPVALHRAMSQPERIGGLLFGETAEETTLDDLRHARLDGRDSVQRVVDLQYDLGLIVDGQVDVVERDSAPSAASLLRAGLARAIDDDVSHRQRGDGEKMRSIAPFAARLLRQLEICLVYERRRRQCSITSAAECSGSEAVVGDSTKLVVCDGNDFVEGFARSVVSQHGFPLRLNESARAVTTTIPTYGAVGGGDSRAAFIHSIRRHQCSRCSLHAFPLSCSL
jgi:hypothetical protein